MAAAGSNHSISIENREGSKVHAKVEIEKTIPAGGITLDVVYDKGTDKVISVKPWRNLGEFILSDLRSKA